MIRLDDPKKFKGLQQMAQQVAQGVFRPISRKYDKAEHTYPRELDALAAFMDGMSASGGPGAGSSTGDGGKAKKRRDPADGSVNGQNMATIMGAIEMCWGDVGLLLTVPNQGLGNAAIAAVASPEQKERFGDKWAAMAITEPEAGSDSASIRTSAVLEGDEWVINGEKIFVTCGERADCIVVWATIDPSMGRAAIKSFVVESGTPGMNVDRLDHKLGIRASDTAVVSFTDCRIPRANLLGSEEVQVKKGFAGVMKTFDNTRPMVAAMAIGVARASLELTKELLLGPDAQPDWRAGRWNVSAIEGELMRLEAELEAARLLTMKAAWMADNRVPNSMHASMAKAKAGRVGNEITLRCVELCGAVGYAEEELLEKWSRDSKILDIFEGTQQIQQLIIARRMLGKRSSELK